jgi:tRNA modification GTPase
MARSYLETERPIAALATSPGRAALAVIRCAGPGSIELCARCFRPAAALLEAPGHTLVHGYLHDPAQGDDIDEVVAAVYRAPRSFTGEDSVELSCHGSPAVVQRVLKVLEAAGFSPALPGEFSFRAFAHGKTDLVRAEAINELAGARSEAARADALARLHGLLSARLCALRSSMLDVLAEVEARLDYPEDESEDLAGEAPWIRRLEAVEKELALLSASFLGGRLRQEGALVVVAGRPNAGKSSLFNLVAREERAIVGPDPGTTRDWLEIWIEIGGFAVRLVDTAGLRHTMEEIEAEGVRRSLDLSARADLLIYMVDGTSGLSQEDTSFIEGHPESLLIWNKIDKPGCAPLPPGWLGLSAKKGTGLPLLEEAIRSMLAQRAGNRQDDGTARYEQEVRIAGQRQKSLVDASLAAIRQALASLSAGASLDASALDIREAADSIGQITGEIVDDEVFDRIFSSFCLGK